MNFFFLTHFASLHSISILAIDHNGHYVDSTEQKLSLSLSSSLSLYLDEISSTLIGAIKSEISQNKVELFDDHQSIFGDKQYKYSRLVDDDFDCDCYDSLGPPRTTNKNKTN